MVIVTACSMPGSDAGEESVAAEETAPSLDGGEEGEAESVPQDGLCANVYYPVREGSTWNYMSTGTAAENLAWTDTITNVRDDGFLLTSEYEELTRTQQWTCKSEGLLALQMGGGAAGGLTTSAAQLIVETQNVSGVTYPAEINAGSQWSHSHEFMGTMDIAGQSAEVTGDEQTGFTAIGMESVTIPAGTFEAMKVESQTTININSTFQGVTVPVTFTSTTTSWYAQGIGWVKSISISDFGGITSTDTIELQWYNIP
jgi:hypothetical protein